MIQDFSILSRTFHYRQLLYSVAIGRSRAISSSSRLDSIRRGGKEQRTLSRFLETNRTLQSKHFTTACTKAMSTTASPAKTLPDAFRRASLYTDDRIYKLLRIPISSMEFAIEIWTNSNTLASPSSSTSPFGAFLVDKDEITLMVDNEVYRDSDTGDASRTVTDNGINYRLFTFDDVVMDPSLVGFMAVVTKALADNHISVLPYAAYSTDHIFVADCDAEKTKTILEDLMTN